MTDLETNRLKILATLFIFITALAIIINVGSYILPPLSDSDVEYLTSQEAISKYNSYDNDVVNVW
jgi:hypothetical protein